MRNRRRTVRRPAAIVTCAVFLTSCGGEREVSPEPALVGGGGTLSAQLNTGTRAILPNEPGKNWVFDAYVSANSPDVAWSRFWTKSIDFSGVAWDKPQTLTMISPRHAVMAKHYQRPPKAQSVLFHDRRGREVQRVIVGREFLGADIAVVILNEDVPDTVKTYPVLSPSDRYEEEFPGTFVLVTDRERKVHVHEVRLVLGQLVYFRRAESLAEGFYEGLIAGDSGNPSFVLVRGQPVLVETHTGGGPGAGPFYGAAENVEAINAAMQKLSAEHGAPGYQLRTVAP